MCLLLSWRSLQSCIMQMREVRIFFTFSRKEVEVSGAVTGTQICSLKALSTLLYTVGGMERLGGLKEPWINWIPWDRGQRCKSLNINLPSQSTKRIWISSLKPRVFPTHINSHESTLSTFPSTKYFLTFPYWNQRMAVWFIVDRWVIVIIMPVEIPS